MNLILGDKTRVIDKGDLLLVICDNLLEDNTLNFLSSSCQTDTVLAKKLSRDPCLLTSPRLAFDFVSSGFRAASRVPLDSGLRNQHATLQRSQ